MLNLSLREVGTIIRSLGCYPSEAELRDMIREVEEDEPTGFIRFDKFQPMMARVKLEKRCVRYIVLMVNVTRCRILGESYS